MSNLILVRHGQSEWNAKNKFTGWVDAVLSEKGKQEARKSGFFIKELDISLNFVFTSLLQRAKKTAEIICTFINKENLCLEEAWELNERHYGSLTGLNKEETKQKVGEKLFNKYRRSWETAPPEIELDSNFLQAFSKSNYRIPSGSIPLTESLKDTYNRVIPYFEKKILPLLKQNQNVLVVAHGNSLRALCKKLIKIDNTKINNLEIPTGNPLFIIFNEDFTINSAKYLDQDRNKNIFV